MWSVWAQIWLTQVSRESSIWWKHASMQGGFSSGLNVSRLSNTKCCSCWEHLHKRFHNPESEKANKAVEIALKNTRSDKKLDLVLCTMDDVPNEQIIEEFISSTNEVAAGMQNMHPVKQLDLLLKLKTRKSRWWVATVWLGYTLLTRKVFIPLLQELGLEVLEPLASCFIKNDPTDIYDAESINESIEAPNDLVKAAIKGKKDVIIKQVIGRTTCYTLEPALFLPHILLKTFTQTLTTIYLPHQNLLLLINPFHLTKIIQPKLHHAYSIQSSFSPTPTKPASTLPSKSPPTTPPNNPTTK